MPFHLRGGKWTFAYVCECSLSVVLYANLMSILAAAI